MSLQRKSDRTDVALKHAALMQLLMIYELLCQLHVARHGLRQRNKACKVRGEDDSVQNLMITLSATQRSKWAEGGVTYVWSVGTPMKNVAGKGKSERRCSVQLGNMPPGNKRIIICPIKVAATQ